MQNAASNFLLGLKSQNQAYLHGYQDLHYMVRQSSIQIKELAEKLDVVPIIEEKPYILSNHHGKTYFNLY